MRTTYRAAFIFSISQESHHFQVITWSRIVTGYSNYEDQLEFHGKSLELLVNSEYCERPHEQFDVTSILNLKTTVNLHGSQLVT